MTRGADSGQVRLLNSARYPPNLQHLPGPELSPQAKGISDCVCCFHISGPALCCHAEGNPEVIGFVVRSAAAVGHSVSDWKSEFLT